MTTWVLLFFFSYDRSYVVHSIQNLRDLNECTRLQAVVQQTLDRPNLKYKCIEVVNK